MSKIIAASMDVSKIDKSKLVEGKNGAKYYNFTIIVNDEKDKFGQDVQLKAGQTKEQRDAKEKAEFIGNGKTVWEGASKKQDVQTAEVMPENNTSDLPF